MSNMLQPETPKTSETKVELLDVVKRVLWWVGFVFLLPVTCGWWCRLPVAILQNFPYPVDPSSDAWYNRLKLTIVIGLACWVTVGIIKIVNIVRDDIKGTSTTTSLPPLAKVLITMIITFLFIVIAVAALVLLNVDFSDIP